jgi:hypothetical protein
MIYEDIVDHNLVLRSLKMEYHDFKYLIHGNKESGPLNIALNLEKDSPVRDCYLSWLACAWVESFLISLPCFALRRMSAPFYICRLFHSHCLLCLPDLYLRDAWHLGLPAKGLRPPVDRHPGGLRYL